MGNMFLAPRAIQASLPRPFLAGGARRGRWRGGIRWAAALTLALLAGCAMRRGAVVARPLATQSGVVALIEAPAPARILVDRPPEGPEWNGLLLENLGNAPVGGIRLRRADGGDLPVLTAGEGEGVIDLLPGEQFACTAARPAAADVGSAPPGGRPTPGGRLLGVMIWDMPTSETALVTSLHRIRAARPLPGRGIALDARGGEALVEFEFKSPAPLRRAELAWRTPDGRTNPAVWISLDGAAWSRQTLRAAAGRQRLDLSDAVRGTRRFYVRLSWGSGLGGATGDDRRSGAAAASPPVLMLASVQLQREFEIGGALASWPAGRHLLKVEFNAPTAPPPALEVRLIHLPE